MLDLLGLGLVILAAAACMVATICANKAAPARRDPGGPARAAGPAGPMESSGGSGGGAGHPAGLPPLPPGRTGAAILNAQCNNKLNLTIGYQAIQFPTTLQ